MILTCSGKGQLNYHWKVVTVIHDFVLFCTNTVLKLLHSIFCRDPLAQFEIEKREHEQKMLKMEHEMEEVFDMKVQEKLQKLKDIEADVSLL